MLQGTGRLGSFRQAVAMAYAPIPAAHVRLYRLTDRQGQPHPVLDECFESLDQALEAAREWLEQGGLVDHRADQRERERQLALQVGVLAHPAPCRFHGMAFCGCLMRPNQSLDGGLAWLGLLVNAAALPWLLQLLGSGGAMAPANWAVGLSAILPALVLGVVASAALLKRRRWGRVVAIVALALSLAVTVSYGVVWLVLVPLGRALVAVGLGVFTVAELLLLIYWCLPRPWWR